MKMRNLLISIFLLSTLNINTTIAATFDFISYADEDANNDGHFEWGYRKFSVTEDNITLNAKGKHWKNGAWKRAYAYLDRGNAGMGVCKSINARGQCSISSDDNVTPEEALFVNFDQTVKLETVLFQNGKHKPVFNDDFKLKIFLDNQWGDWQTFALDHIFNSSLIGDGFAFYNPNKFNRGEDRTKQFYIEALTVSLAPTITTASVPSPGTLLLLLAGIAGFSFNSSRKTKLMAC